MLKCCFTSTETVGLLGNRLNRDGTFFIPGVDASRVYMRAWAHQYPDLSEGTDGVGGPLRGDKECPFSGVTKSGRVWRKVPESDARSVTQQLTRLGEGGREAARGRVDRRGGEEGWGAVEGAGSKWDGLFRLKLASFGFSFRSQLILLHVQLTVRCVLPIASHPG